MSLVHRVLAPTPVADLEAHLRRHGGRGLDQARAMTPDEVVKVVEASGLRGRGGAGFPTGRKWRTVHQLHADALPTSVVVNAAEGEPGTFKDRQILLLDPFSVVEGALIAAYAVGAAEVVISQKAINTETRTRLEQAITEIDAAGWTDGVSVSIADGPDEYLFGEETALLEVVDGRLPFPRIAPPWRRGITEVVLSPRDVDTGSGLSAHVEMVGSTGAPPTLVNNVETMANISHLLARGADWFRTEGTDETPGTFVTTIVGDTVRDGLGELLAGTTLRDAITLVGGGMPEGRQVKAVLSGVSNRVITVDQLDTPISYEAMQALQIGPGSAGFIVYDDTTDMVAVAAGVSRFLSIESCGQCTPCKLDGMAITRLLTALAANEASPRDVAEIQRRLGTVADSARCFLGNQQQITLTSILEAFPAEVEAHLHGDAAPTTPVLITKLRNLRDGVATWDVRHAGKQPDWTYEDPWTGRTPAERYGEHRAHEELAE